MRKVKKVMSLLLALALIISVFPVQVAFADTSNTITFAETTADLSTATGDYLTVVIPVEISTTLSVANMKLTLDLPTGWTVSNVKDNRSGNYNIYYSYEDDGTGEKSYAAVKGYNGITANERVITISTASAATSENGVTEGTLFWVFVQIPTDYVNGTYYVGIDETVKDNKIGTTTTMQSGGNEFSSFTIEKEGVIVTGGVDEGDVEPKVEGPKSVTVNYGETTTLEVTASATFSDSITYQWYEVSESGEKTEVGTNSATYTPDTNKVGVKSYYCDVTNTYNGVTKTTTSGTATVTVVASPLTLMLSETEYTYDGTRKEPIITVTGSNKTALTETGEGSSDDGYYVVASSETTGTDVGEYTISVIGTGGYEGSTDAETWKITKAQIEASDMTVNAYEGAPAVSIVPSYKLADGATTGANITYEVTSGSEYITESNGSVTVTGTVPDAGATAAVKATISDPNGNHEDKEVTITVNVQKKQDAEASTTADLTQTYAYDENTSHALSDILGKVSVKNTSTNGSWTYSVTDKTTGETKEVAEADLASTSISEGGEYVVTATYVDDQYMGTVTINVEITKKTITVDSSWLTLDNDSLQFNEKAQTVTASLTSQTNSDKVEITNGETDTQTAVGTYSFDVTLGVKEDYARNYEVSGSPVSMSWEITQADSATLSLEKSLLYSNTDEQSISGAINEAAQAAGVTLGGYTVSTTPTTADSNGILGTVSTNTYQLASGLAATDANKSATITVTFESANYKAVTLTLTVTVIDKNDVSEQITFEDGTSVYNGEKQSYETATYNGSSAGITYTYSDDPINVGTYTVTAKYEDEENIGTQTADFTITKAPLTITGATVEENTYSGSELTPAITAVEFSGLQNGETLDLGTDYTVSNAKYESSDAGSQEVTFDVTLSNTTKANNYELKDDSGSSTGTIGQKTIEISVEDIASQEFTGSAIKPRVTVTATDGTTLATSDYTVTYTNNINVGTATATISPSSSSNYTFEAVTKDFEITKKTLSEDEIPDTTVTYKCTDSGKRTVQLKLPANCGSNVSCSIGDVASNIILSGTPGVDGNGNVTFTLAGQKKYDEDNATVTVPVNVSCQNYNDFTANLIINLSKKEVPVLTVTPIIKTYNGEQIRTRQISGTATVDGKEIPGTWSFKNSNQVAKAINASSTPYYLTVVFTPDDTDLYEIVEGTLKVTINKATPTGTPSYRRITEAGESLVAASLDVGTITPSGTIRWDDGNSTTVELGVAYKWTFTPDDTTNYTTLTGEITPYLYTANPLGVDPASASYSGRPSNSTLPSDNDKNQKNDKTTDTTEQSGTESGETTPSTTTDITERFLDVEAGKWYTDAIAEVVEKGLMTGVSSNTFAPDESMNRAMVVTVLWRLEGEPESTLSNPFTDCVADSWYYDAVTWANSVGVVTGYNATTFGPQDNVTREQLVTILYRYAKTLGVDVTASDSISSFADAASVSSYAVDAMNWAVSCGLIEGMTGNKLSPQSNATRAQVAVILTRFADLIAE